MTRARLSLVSLCLLVCNLAVAQTGPVKALVVLANVDGAICALRDQCSHEAYPLSDGELDGGDIVCAYHGARFDACTGARKALPAVLPVQAFPVDVRDGEIFVEVDA